MKIEDALKHHKDMREALSEFNLDANESYDLAIAALEKQIEYEELEANGQLLKLPQPLTETAKFEIIRGYQTGEIIEVVKCKDCKHVKYNRCINKTGILGPLKSNDYCSYGERR
jgi:hypothetical protein